MNSVGAKRPTGDRKSCYKRSGIEQLQDNDVSLELLTRADPGKAEEVDFATRSDCYVDGDEYTFESSSFSAGSVSTTIAVRTPKEKKETETENNNGGCSKWTFSTPYFKRCGSIKVGEETGRRKKHGLSWNFFQATRSRETTPSASEGRFKFPTVNLAVCLFPKKRNRLKTNGDDDTYSANGTENQICDRSTRYSISDSNLPIAISLAEDAEAIEMVACERNPQLRTRLNNIPESGNIGLSVEPKQIAEEDAARAARAALDDQGALKLSFNQDGECSNADLHSLTLSSMNMDTTANVGAVKTEERGYSSDCGFLSSSETGSYRTALHGCWRMEDAKSTLGNNTNWAKYKLLKEGQVQVSRLNHPRNMLGKVTTSRLLRRWETHTLVLDADDIYSRTPVGYFEHPVKYVNVEGMHHLSRWDSSGDKFCLRIFVPEGSLLLQTNRLYVLNQWFYSIQWKRSLFRCRRIIESNCDRSEVLLKELKSVVEQARHTPLQAEDLNVKPIRLARLVLQQISDGKWPQKMIEPILSCIAPLLDRITTISEVSYWLGKHCRESPTSRVVEEVFADIALLTLKKNMDFGKYVSACEFVQELLFALAVQNGGCERVRSFVRKAHGQSSSCPHPRVLPNLVSVCLAAIHRLHDGNSVAEPIQSQSCSRPPVQDAVTSAGFVSKVSMTSVLGDLSSLSSGSFSDSINKDGGSICPSILSSLSSPSCSSGGRKADCGGSIGECRGGGFEYHEIAGKQLACVAAVFETMSEFEDWRLPLASLLQPVPFPEQVFSHEAFMIPMSRLIRRLGADKRCEVHLAVLGVRDDKEGWFHLVCPGGPACVDDGNLYASLLDTLLRCCCRRKKFLRSLNVMLGPLQLMALRECIPAMEALCDMLELEVVERKTSKLQVITALRSTPAGKAHYETLRDRQFALRELQQKGGPRKLTFPSKSTDADVAVLLSSGSFGNLEWLSLAFTNVTSSCAEYLIKLPTLRYLNLWSTQFGDVGLQLISDHLHKLQVLNLCETPVTDKGLRALTGLTNLRKLNLNSTQLSAATFQMLRAKLPTLQEVDVRYTDAWCADEFLS